MMTRQQLIEIIYADRDTCGEASRLEVEDIVKKTIETLGFSVNERTGEIVDPRPQPVNVFTAPRQQNVRWRGGRKLK